MFLEGDKLTKQEIYPEYFEHKPFNRWHRKKLNEKCYATDLDLIERRKGRGIVAFLEIKEKANLTYFQKLVFVELTQRTGIPFYFINHNKELTEFKVYRLHGMKNDDLIKVEPFPMIEKECIAFVEGL